jgi:hypothetical protein
MELTATRTIDTSSERLWALQLDHAAWPGRLPNFSKVERSDHVAPFGIGSSAVITQPGLGTVTWTVVEFDEQPHRRSFAWTGRARGTTYTARHLVESEPDGRTTQLTLGIVAEGGLPSLLAPLVRGRMQKAIDDEAAAFEKWATEARSS